MSGTETDGAFSNLFLLEVFSPTFVCASLNLSLSRQIQAFTTTVVTAALAHHLDFMFIQKELLLLSLILPERLPNTTVSLIISYKTKQTAIIAAMEKGNVVKISLNHFPCFFFSL